MNPEQRITQLENEVRMLTGMIREMQGVNTITPEFKQVLDRSVVTSSGKTIASETQAVDEGGSATYNVQKVPDLYITIGGYIIPAYTS